MLIFIYGIIPAFILACWYSIFKALARRPPHSIADFIFIFVVLIVMPVGYAYLVWRRIKPIRDKKINNESLLRDLYNFAMKDDYIWVGLDFNKRYASLYNGLWFKSRNKKDCDFFNFNEHGYVSVDTDKMIDILRQLEHRTGGYLKITNKEIGGYSPSVSVTHGTMPGGGDGYYVNVGGYDSAIIPQSAYVILGDEAERWRQADRDRKNAKSKLKQL